MATRFAVARSLKWLPWDPRLMNMTIDQEESLLEWYDMEAEEEKRRQKERERNRPRR